MNIPVDKTYIIHLAENTDRKAVIEENYAKIGLTDYEYWWTSKKPYLNNQIAHAIYNDPSTTINLKDNIYDNQYLQTKDISVLGRVFDCSYTMYTCMSVAYARGFEHIAIFEDDVMFKEDLKPLIEECFDPQNFPQDYDLIRYHSGAWNDNLPKRFPDEYYIHYKDPRYFGIESDDNWKGGIFSIAILSRKGMECFMKFYETQRFVTDMIYYASWPYLLHNNLNIYVCCKNIIKTNIDAYFPSTVWTA